MMKIKTEYTLAELTKDLEVTIKGDPNCVITGISPIQQAKTGHLTFLSNPLYRKHLSSTTASAVILSEDDASLCHTNAIVSRNPYFTYAKIAGYFAAPVTVAAGIHPSAVIGENAEIHLSASIGANCVIGAAVVIGANVIVGAGSVIGDFSTLDENTRLDANVTIYHQIKIGKRVNIASGVVIGSDGFGIANQSGVWHKVPQLGTVEIGDDVDIGANTSIDRGAVENTVIENGVKLDNLIQVGHNVRIGANTVIAGCVAIAGSAVIGKNCMIGGTSAIAGHVSVADGVILTGMTTVTKSITERGMYSSGIVGAVPSDEFRKNIARFNRMDNLIQRVKSLESVIKELTERKDA